MTDDERPASLDATLGAEAPPDSPRRTLGAPQSGTPREADGLPTAIGRFRVLRRLGVGGMGVVFAGYDLELDRKVAIKLLLIDRGEGSIGRTRLLREAQAMARLSHPNVIPIYEVGTFTGQIYLAMEFVQGLTLEAWQAERRRPWPELLAMYLQAARGLAAAHAAGLVHRDFKPDNALVGADGRLRILDFGLATRGGLTERSAPATEAEAMLTSALDQSITRVGSVMGTPAYMSPEQALGAQVDARSDQFSLCVALWEALHGERPFGGDSLAALSLNLTAGVMRAAPRGARLPGWLHRALLRGLHTDPARRWPDMSALITELSQGPGRMRRRLLAAGGVALGIGVAVAAVRPGAAVPEPCAGGPARLVGLWDDGVRAAGERAALASGLPIAADTWMRTATALDDYTARWLDGYREACLAHHRGEQSDALLDLRMRCLEQRRDELSDASALLQEPDPKTVERGPQIVGALGELAACADGQALAASVPPPQDPEVAREVEALRRVLTRARVLETAARYKDALTLAQQVVAAAGPLGYPPALAEAEVRVGRLLNRTGKFAEAAAQLEDAYYTALAARHDEIAGDAAVRLVRLHGDRLDDEVAAKRWERSAGAFAARAGPASALAGNLSSGLGVLHMKRGRYEAAREAFERMVASRESQPSPTDDLADGLSNLGGALEALGRLSEAEARLERALEIRTRLFGPEHPNTAMTLANLANVYGRREEWAKARAANERIVAIFERDLGPEHANTAMMYINLAKALGALNDPDARRRYQQAVTAFTAAFGADSQLLAEARTDYAGWLVAQGELAAAALQVEQALPVLRRSASGDPAMARDRLQLARMLGADPRFRAPARALAEQAAEVFMAAGASTDVEAARAWLAAQPDRTP